MPIIELASVSRTSLPSVPGIGGLPETVAASCAQRRGCSKFWGSTGETLATDIQPKLPDPRGITTWSPQPPTSTSMPACSRFARGKRCPRTKRFPAWPESIYASKLQALLLIHDCIKSTRRRLSRRTRACRIRTTSGDFFAPLKLDVNRMRSRVFTYLCRYTLFPRPHWSTV